MWREWDTDKPVFKQDTDCFGYVLVWSRSSKVVLIAHHETLTKGARWQRLPPPPTEVMDDGNS
jgi:hypothetical protein